MLKFAKSPVYIPDPARPRPLITEDDKQRAAADPPWPVPFHCKPWVDGQTVGWTLFYGYLTPITIIGLENGRVEVENLAELTRETQQPRVIDQFAERHFGLSSGYYLQTPQGMVSLLVPALRAPAGLELLTGVIETDWYPRPIFLVYKAPTTGVRIALEYKMELARVVVIPRHEGFKAEALDAAELETLAEQEKRYKEEEKTTPTRWQAATGDSFTHLYKVWSKRFREGEEADV
ncbi:MAG: hypothetical protein KDE51_20620 [Anaerolineales bacterium]|nr:hypothetical protein [Anaerolineales bacterium]